MGKEKRGRVSIKGICLRQLRGVDVPGRRCKKDLEAKVFTITKLTKIVKTSSLREQ